MLSLSTLMSRVLDQLTVEAESAFDAEAPSLAVWANVLRCLAEGALEERELAAAARISKRLTSAAITTVSKRGWVTADPETGKNRVLQLTAAGAAAAEAWPLRLAEVDRPWAATTLREALESIVGRLPFELPHSPASYGSADPSAIGGPYMQYAKRDEGVPAHGKDWRPVHRGDGDTVSSLPITALLSQALMAFTIDYEDNFPWPLANTATVLVHVGTAPTPLSALPPNHMITGKGTSLLERHAIVDVSPEGVVLSYRGEQVIQNHPGRLETTESAWRERYGDESITALRAALTERAPSDGPAHIMWSGS